MRNYKKWTNDETDYIKNYHSTISDEDLAKKLTQLSSQSVTTSMIRRQRRKLLIVKKRGRLTNKVDQGESGAKIGQEGKGENNE